MEPTGWDSVLFTTARPGRVAAQFAADLLARWPEAALDHDGRLTPLAVVTDWAAQFGKHSLAFPYFVRDAAMSRWADDHAYEPMPDGDGPVALMARRRRVRFAVGRVRESWAADHASSPGRPPDPYPACLVGRFHELALITPADPSRDPFSRWCLRRVLRHCVRIG